MKKYINTLHLTSLIDLSAIKFLLVGLINTFTGLTVIYFCKWFLLINDYSSNFIGYSIGICVSFYLNSKWTFKYKGMQIRAIIKFGLVIFISYLLNLALVIILIKVFHINGDIAQPFGIFPYTIFCYLGCRFWVFSKKQDGFLNRN